MATNNILTKSDKFTEEYCCSIVRIGEIHPIEGKDRIGRTLVNGETIVVNKNQVKEGQVYIYASNETQLNTEFLSKNNLFESGSWELNSNAEEVRETAEARRRLNDIIRDNKNLIEKMTKIMKYINEDYEKELNATDNDKEREAIVARLERVRDYAIRRLENTLYICDENADNNTVVLALEKFINERQLQNETDEKHRVEFDDFMRAHCGFFGKNGRVRAIKLGGILSMGYLFDVNELIRYNKNVESINIEELVGQDFDTVDGVEFVKAYVPPMPAESRRRSKGEKRNKKIERFDRMIKGEFLFHYDTNPLKKNIQNFKPDDVVTISTKVHGTSICIGKVHVKQPIKLPIFKRLFNFFIDTTGLFKSKRIIDYTIEYGNVTSSRTVIKNQYINKNVNGGFYGEDIWTEYGDLFYPYLDEGMTVYGEIVGYTKGGKSIQPSYDYGCEPNCNKLMPYRITTSNEDGTKREWSVMEVKEWTENLQEKLKESNPDLYERIMVIEILYHGTLADMYPELSLTEHWHENIIEAMCADKKRLGMEGNEYLCKNKVPREGIVVRCDNSEIPEAYKLKTEKFFARERKLIDEGKVDIEMFENF